MTRAKIFSVSQTFPPKHPYQNRELPGARKISCYKSKLSKNCFYFVLNFYYFILKFIWIVIFHNLCIYHKNVLNYFLWSKMHTLVPCIYSGASSIPGGINSQLRNCIINPCNLSIFLVYSYRHSRWSLSCSSNPSYKEI